MGEIARISHRLTVEARDRPAITSLRLLAVLNVLSRTPPFVKPRAPRTDAPLTHFASPRGEKSGLARGRGAVMRDGAKSRARGDSIEGEIAKSASGVRNSSGWSRADRR